MYIYVQKYTNPIYPVHICMHSCMHAYITTTHHSSSSDIQSIRIGGMAAVWFIYPCHNIGQNICIGGGYFLYTLFKSDGKLYEWVRRKKMKLKRKSGIFCCCCKLIIHKWAKLRNIVEYCFLSFYWYKIVTAPQNWLPSTYFQRMECVSFFFV